MKRYLSIAIIIFLVNICLLAQGEGVLSTSTLQQSPLLLGSGQIGVSLPNDEVLGYYYNPAILGYSARENHISFSIMPSKAEWSRFGSVSPTYNNMGLNLGYNLKSEYDLPISIGLGYLNYKFDFHGLDYSGNKIESYDLYNSMSIGAAIDYYLKFSLGISFKSYESKLGNYSLEELSSNVSAKGSMVDYGGLLLIPISNLILKDTKIAINENVSIYPISKLSFGYSVSDRGNELIYIDPAQADPLSRTARLGYTIDLGLNLELEGTNINLVNYSFSAEAQDILIKRGTSGFNYQSGIGDISISNNILNLKSDNNGIVHKGHIIKLLDTIIITSGRFSGRGYSQTRKTSGLGFSSKGIFTLLNKYSENNVLKYITKHFVIDYFDADVEFFESEDTNFGALSIHFRGFEI